MLLYPAIDLMDGQVVRLVEGDFGQKTVFPTDPLELLAQFSSQGACYLHLVDLSGARDPQQRQKTLLKKILSETALKVQLGGGLRSLEEIEELLDLGADRVVLGSLIVTQPQIASAALEKFGPQRLTFAVDVRLENGRAIVKTHGWTRSSGKTLQDIIAPFINQGLERVLCTDIAVDGRLVGPNVELYKTLSLEFPNLQIQASGGVETLQDLKTLAQSGTHSAVVGRALLSGKFSVAEALIHAE